MLPTVVLLISFALEGQAPGPPQLRFEVATIKPNKDGGGKGGLDIQPGGGLKMQGATLKDLIAFAYDVRETQVGGGAKWVDSEAYDILARPEYPSPEDLPQGVVAPGTNAWDRVRLRLQTLLADRFQLAVHKSSREVQGYALVPAKGGPKLTATSESGNPSTMRSRGHIIGQRATMQMLCVVLGNWLGRPVVDRTGLKEAYTYKLEYTQEDQSVDPSVFTALQEQLGLKLEPTRATIDSIVIDRASRPSAN